MWKKFLKSTVIVSGVLSCITLPSLVYSDDSKINKQQVESIIHDYLINNPELLIEVSQKLQQKRQDEITQKSQQAISANAKEIFSVELPTQIGSTKANVTLVEFFDYQCLHCKSMAPIIKTVINKNSNLRVIYKELPIFGKSSEAASKAALAAAKQGKYHPMHDALISKKGHITIEYINNMAKKIGLDLDQFNKDVKSKEIQKNLDNIQELAKKLNLMGTPAFIIASTPNGEYKVGNNVYFVPGAATEEALVNLINKSSNSISSSK